MWTGPIRLKKKKAPTRKCVRLWPSAIAPHRSIARQHLLFCRLKKIRKKQAYPKWNAMFYSYLTLQSESKTFIDVVSVPRNTKRRRIQHSSSRVVRKCTFHLDIALYKGPRRARRLEAPPFAFPQTRCNWQRADVTFLPSSSIMCAQWIRILNCRGTPMCAKYARIVVHMEGRNAEARTSTQSHKPNKNCTAQRSGGQNWTLFPTDAKPQFQAQNR
jgi:hypothetical protein